LLAVGKFGASLVTAIGLKAKLGISSGNFAKDVAFVSDLFSEIDKSGQRSTAAIDDQAKAAAKRNAIQSAYLSLMDEQAKNLFDESNAETQLNTLLEFRRKLLTDLGKSPGRSVENAKKLLAVEQVSHDIAKKRNEVDDDREKTIGP